ncbi:hypothetical protein CK203_060251 [Vitis vinifera]|uniref:Uncharacterized protein n=1 Tax=Vitis vinifera TaxID=29760 RepID=A0A438GLN7_VITVI|nr:hypothetical protein CK203_060251 [Vitis vinifera]
MWKVCYPTVYLWSQVGSSLSGHLLVAILELSAKGCDDFSNDVPWAIEPIALGFLALVVLLEETRIAFTIHTFLAFFPFYLAKLGIAYKHWLIELQEVY